MKRGRTAKPRAMPEGPSLPSGARVTLERGAGGPTITLSDVPPAEVHAALDWLEAVWAARRVPVPYHTDVVPGSTSATSTVEDGDWGDRKRRVGF